VILFLFISIFGMFNILPTRCSYS